MKVLAALSAPSVEKSKRLRGVSEPSWLNGFSSKWSERSRKRDLEPSTSLENPPQWKPHFKRLSGLRNHSSKPAGTSWKWDGLTGLPFMPRSIFIDGRRLQSCQQSFQIAPVFFLWPILLCEVGNGSEWRPIILRRVNVSSVASALDRELCNRYTLSRYIFVTWDQILLEACGCQQAASSVS